MPLLISLRPATPEDEPLLLQIYSSTREEELAVTGWSPPQMEAFLRMQFDAQHRHYHEQCPDAAYDIILSANTDTGFQPVLSLPRLVAELPSDPYPAGRLYVDRRPNEIHIIDIALLPNHRNKGIGTVLLESLIAEAKTVGKRVTIYVERNNPARTLYDRLGFTVTQEHDLYLLMGKASDLLMPSRYNERSVESA